jgi:hypothetical protein
MSESRKTPKSAVLQIAVRCRWPKLAAPPAGGVIQGLLSAHRCPCSCGSASRDDSADCSRPPGYSCLINNSISAEIGCTIEECFEILQRSSVKRNSDRSVSEQIRVSKGNNELHACGGDVFTLVQEWHFDQNLGVQI